MAGWFELDKNSDDRYRFAPKARDGEIILTSELHTVKGVAEKEAASVQVSSLPDEHYEKKTAANSELHFNLKTVNRQITGSSQLYANEQPCETGIASVKTNSTNQTIKDKV